MFGGGGILYARWTLSNDVSFLLQFTSQTEMTVEGVEGVYGILTGSAFGINGCKVADGGREDSNGLLIGFSLLGVSGEVFCDYLVVCEAFQLVTRHNTTLSLVALLCLHSFMV